MSQLSLYSHAFTEDKTYEKFKYLNVIKMIMTLSNSGRHCEKDLIELFKVVLERYQSGKHLE